MNIRNTLFRTAALATLITGAGQGVALAQGAQAGNADEEEAIVVTARKREEVLQDVPIAVTAFSASAIEDRQIQNTTDLAAFTPGFSMSEAFGRDGDRPIIRGTSNILVGDGKVGFFIDGAPILGDTTAIDLDAFQRVEVIKGPQAAVFGRGTLSGAINYVTRLPGDEFSGKVEGTLGNWGRADLYARLEGPLPVFGDAVKYSLAYKSYNFDGDYNNKLDLANRLGAQKSETWNAALFLAPADNIDIRLRYMNAVDNDGHFAVGLQPGSANNCFLTTRPTFCGTVKVPEALSINTADILRPGLERKTERFIFSSVVDIPNSDLSVSYQATSAHQSEVSGYDQSYDGRTFHLSAGFAACAVPVANRRCGFSPFNDTSGFDEFANTHEIRLDYAGDGPLSWRVGMFKLDRTRKSQFELLEFYTSGTDTTFTKAKTDTFAVFGGVDYSVSDRLTLGFEVRQNRDEISDLTYSRRLGDIVPVLPAGVLSPNLNAIVGTTTPDRTQVFEKTLPRVSATFEVSDDVTLYAQYAVGNSPGGFNQAAAPQQTFNEEQLTNYEFGIKSSVLGFDYLNLSGFFMKYDDQVLTTTFAGLTAQQSYNFNIGAQDIKGIEFEAQRKLFEGFTMTGTLSYIDGEFTKGSDPQQALFRAGAFCSSGASSATNPWGYGTNATFVQTGTGAPLTTSTPPQPNGTTVLTSTVVTPNGGVPAGLSCSQLGSIVGQKSPLVPPLQASLSARYERDITDNVTMFAGADVVYRDSFYGQVDNFQEVGASTKVNAQFGFETGRVKVTLWGRNLNNDETPTGSLRYVDFLAPPPPGPTLTGGTTTAPAGGPGFQGTTRAFAITAPRKPAGGITVAFNW
jgi:outer membrane receptor protein involved in Fe transport